ncbi:MAG TPA: xanthine dehydrogenase family protein subunit M [Clostridia bacterium]|nr:xanthine dehydrogenase family protein subunit M [Clostridia bacterium]
MDGFDFISAVDLDDALTILARGAGNACPVAGGTNVVVKAQSGRLKDKLLVGIDRIEALSGIREENGMITIGALTTLAEIANSALLKEEASVLWQAAQVFADPVIRNRATVGGNIADASPTADTAPALLVLQAEVLVKSLRGARAIPIDDFFYNVCKTALEDDELIVAVRFRPCRTGAFVKLGLRNAMAKTLISAAAIVQLDKTGKVETCTIAMGSVAPRPIRARRAEQAIIGKNLTEETYTQLKEAVLLDIDPIESIRASKFYRSNVACTIAERAVQKAAYSE